MKKLSAMILVEEFKPFPATPGELIPRKLEASVLVFITEELSQILEEIFLHRQLSYV